MTTCFFATDLHGHIDRYEKLFDRIRKERPAAVFLGGDLFPHGSSFAGSDGAPADFVTGYLAPEFARLRQVLGDAYPAVILILGNDDPRCEEESLGDAEGAGAWHYIHGRRLQFRQFAVYGYSCVPPTPFLLKDWERYDVSRYVGPGCLAPEEGYWSKMIEDHEVRWGTIQNDLDTLARDDDLDRAIFLLHAPPYGTALDRAALDGKTFEHVPLDVHVGSIAVARFIEERRPLLTLHGHVHESARLTGSWKIRLGRTVCINGAHDGPELALVCFDPEAPDLATRELL